MDDNLLHKANELKQQRDAWSTTVGVMYNYGIPGIHNPAKLEHVERVVRSLSSVEIKQINAILYGCAMRKYTEYEKQLKDL